MTEGLPAKPITDHIIGQMEDFNRLAAEVDDPGELIAEGIGRLWQAVAQAVSQLEAEVVLLREVVHGNDPTLRLDLPHD